MLVPHGLHITLYGLYRHPQVRVFDKPTSMSKPVDLWQEPAVPIPVPGQTHTLSYRYGFGRVRVQVGKFYLGVTCGNPYL
jgi:hypothetical protein